MFLIFLLILVFGADGNQQSKAAAISATAAVASAGAEEKPSYDLNTYQTTGALSLFKKDVFGDSWQYHVLEDLNDSKTRISRNIKNTLQRYNIICNYNK